MTQRLLPFFFFLIFFSTAQRLFAQAEHVAVSHPVYLFLDRMQASARITEYSRTALPLERKQVTEFLRTLQTRRGDLSGSDADLLARFYDEFVSEADGTQERFVLFNDKRSFSGVLDESFQDKEKFLYTWASESRSTTFFMEFLGSAEYRALMGETRNTNVSLGQVGGRFRGTAGGVIGYMLQATNGAVFGDRTLALDDPRLRQNKKYNEQKTDYFDITEAYVSGSWDWGHLSLGREYVRYGNSPVNPVIISANAQSFDALRLNIGFGDFRFSWMHGFLLSRREFVETFRPYYDSKYIALHRAEMDLFDAVRLGVFETALYSQREIDPGYLNPINFYKSAEHQSGDRDNSALGFDFQTLGLGWAEFYGTWYMDDADFSKFGTDVMNNKFILQGGVLTSALIPNTDLGAEYTRVDPYVYSHFFENNEYTHNGDVLGTEVPPNGEEYSVFFRHWLGAKAWFSVRYSYRRHGLNETDSTGTVINHGADPAIGFLRGRDTDHAPFLAGPRETTHLLTASIRWEPIRNYILTASYRYRNVAREDSSIDTNDHLMALLLEVEY